jgi:hypothetical protein
MDEDHLDAGTEAEIVQLLLCGEHVRLMRQDLHNGVAEGHVEMDGRHWRLWLAPEDN